MSEQRINEQKIREQVTAYTQIRPVYEEYVAYLCRIFTTATRKLRLVSMISGRAKGIPNFAEKAVRKQEKYPDPVNMFDDLCGVRIIVNFSYEIEPICDLIRKYFDIDEAGSEDVGERLGESEFGYRSVHFTISLDEQKLTQLYAELGIDSEELPFPRSELFYKHLLTARKEADSPVPRFRAEVQVRTLLAHAWAEFAHDRIYKSPFEVPIRIRRDTNRIAANLEHAENEFSRIVKGIMHYKTSLGPYQTRDQKKAELQRLEIIVEYDPDNIDLCQQIARMAMSLEDWTRATNRLSPFVDQWEQSIAGNTFRAAFDKIDMKSFLSPLEETDDPAIKELERLRDPYFSNVLMSYGISKWKNKEKNGRQYLEWAAALDRNNTVALSALAETYLDESNVEEAFLFFEKAYQIAPADPTSLCGYVSCRIMQSRNAEFLDLIKPSLEGVIQTCLDHIAVNLHLPQVHFELGFFFLLLGRPYESLDSFARGVVKSDTIREISETLQKLENLLPCFRSSTDVPYKKYLEWAIRYLHLAKYVKQQQSNAALPEFHQQLAKLSSGTLNVEKIAGAAVRIVAGGTDERYLGQLLEYKTLLEEVFAGFDGVIFSGGTTSGISGIVGDLPTGMKIAYLPEYTPAWAEKHRQYEVIPLKGSGFSPQEPLQNWTDLLAAGIKPREVRLLAINGGAITAFEIKLAVSLGALVGVVRGSGRAVLDITEDETWSKTDGLLILPKDPFTIREFIQIVPSVGNLSEADKERMAEDVHRAYQEDRKKQQVNQDPATSDWDFLPESLKTSNRRQVDHIEEKLRMIGYTVRKVSSGSIELHEFTDDQIEYLAEREHARWNVERLLDGWVLGEKNVEKKMSPWLIPWAELPDKIKEYDRAAIKKIPENLSIYGYEIIPLVRQHR